MRHLFLAETDCVLAKGLSAQSRYVRAARVGLYSFENYAAFLLVAPY